MALLNLTSLAAWKQYLLIITNNNYINDRMWDCTEFLSQKGLCGEETIWDLCCKEFRQRVRSIQH